MSYDYGWTKAAAEILDLLKPKPVASILPRLG
jgi:hypothetical protein